MYSLDTPNLARLAKVLSDLDAKYVDPVGRDVKPSPDRLESGGHHLLRTRYGRLDVRGSVGSGRRYADLVPLSREVSIHGMTVLVLALETQIEIKTQTGRPKDRAVLELLQETLSERDTE